MGINPKLLFGLGVRYSAAKLGLQRQFFTFSCCFFPIRAIITLSLFGPDSMEEPSSTMTASSADLWRFRSRNSVFCNWVVAILVC